jgi:hypothetical protein
MHISINTLYSPFQTAPIISVAEKYNDSKLQMSMFSFGGEREASSVKNLSPISKKKVALKVRAFVSITNITHGFVAIL